MLLKKTVVMVGMMGAGKTAVGKSLALELGVPFRDSDDEIVKAANMSIAEIFERDGEAFFRAAETRVLDRLIQEEPGILSTGGGVFLQPQNRQVIQDHGISVCIKADIDLLWSRVKNKNTRPLLQTDNPRQTLIDLYTARELVYETSDVVVESRPEFSITDTRDAIITALMDAGLLVEENSDD